jgi:hypothetical protein
MCNSITVVEHHDERFRVPQSGREIRVLDLSAWGGTIVERPNREKTRLEAAETAATSPTRALGFCQPFR